MSIAVQIKRPMTSEVTVNLLSSETRHGDVHEVEAPERAEHLREAPELRCERGVEAPDAGHGRAALLEHEFTHGRSQS
jgi:hypothetical protein